MNRNDALAKAAECLDQASAHATHQPEVADVYVRTAGTWLVLADRCSPAGRSIGTEKVKV